MFRIEEANKYCNTLSNARGMWKCYEHTTSEEKTQELQDVVNKQPRGKKHLQKSGENVACVLPKNNIYVYETADGPTVFVIAFGDNDSISIDRILGCETSGAVEPHYIDAIKALTQTDRDFEMKIEESAKEKLAKGEELNKEETLMVRTFLPPIEYTPHAQEAMIGGGGAMGGFMSSMQNAHASGNNQTQQGQNQNQNQNNQQQQQDQQQQQQDQQDQTQNNQQSAPQNQGAAQADPIINQLALITIVRDNLPMNSAQIRQVLESIETGTAVETEAGQVDSVTQALTPETVKQIEEFLNHPDNAKYQITRGEKYIKLCAKMKLIKLPEEEQEAKPEESKPKPEVQPAFEKMEDELQKQLESSESLPEPEKTLPEIYDPKLTEPVNDANLNHVKIRTDKHKGRQ